MTRGDIAYINLPLIPSSRVQGGRRPAIIVTADKGLRGTPMTMVTPLTTKLVATRFPFTFQIDPSQKNGLTSPSIALVFQLCAADNTHIDSVIGHLEDHYLTQLDEMLREMLGL